MPIEIQIPMENTFNLPEGNYRGQLHSISKKLGCSPKTGENRIRFLFEMDIPSIKNRTPMSGRTFDLNLNGNSELRRFLEGWLGKKYFEKNCGKSLDLESLVEREADLKLFHFQQVGFNKPMVCIEGAFPPGTLDLTERPLFKLAKG